ncbi:hypothetical protein [Bacillus cereus group sp. BY8-1LC]|uniref:hypothetical protein n=1 Tax=Bacillus cereus group sp. BY8-1LC TaxID=3018076 RepID=UPI0022E89A8A|nr:hypothetical protein [Bacillus cereus group sp. BY8-1LC]MDA1793771.1 hypothetical protein [Bacillus cereus group sp. BY8-1LC]
MSRFAAGADNTTSLFGVAVASANVTGGISRPEGAERCIATFTKLLERLRAMTVIRRRGAVGRRSPGAY